MDAPDIPFDNILTVLWGMVAFVGAAVTFIIPQTKAYYDRFVQSVLESDRKVARNWILVVGGSPLAVLALVAITFVAAGSAADWKWKQPETTDFWLLLLTILVQLAFVAVVWLLIGRLPKKLEPQSPMKPIELVQPGELKSTAGGKRTSVKFVNKTAEVLEIHWINYDGERVKYESLNGPGEAIRVTWVGHPFVIVTEKDKRDLAFFWPQRSPAVVEIKQELFQQKEAKP